MNKCAVIIGVNKVHGLPTLSAAVKGAKHFESWAGSQGYDSKLFIDDVEPVTISQIKNSIKQFVEERIYSIMIIYFAGHGILKGPCDEQWLLSEAPLDSNEAVNVQASRFLSRNAGIPHIVFISDACRSHPDSYLMGGVIGSVIFPNILVNQNPCSIDMFYATIPGNPAYEVKSNTSKNYKGIYTDCLVKGLNGADRDIITWVNGDCVVEAYPLSKYLEEVVQERIENFNIGLNQFPDAEITSRAPKYLSIIADGSEMTVGSPKIEEERKNNLVYLNVIDSRDPEVTFKNYTSEIEDSINFIINSKGKESSEIRTGFTIVGASDVEPVCRSDFNVFSENDSYQINITPLHSNDYDYPLTLLLKIDGKSIPLAVLPDFIGTVVIEKDQIANVNYLPSENSYKFDLAVERTEEMNKRRALIATAARNGTFRIKGDMFSVIWAASYLRQNKATDPTLGLYASYAYAQAGNIKQVNSIYRYMRREREPVLFDIIMFNAIDNKLKVSINKLQSMRKIAPFCPLLTQGWSYLSIDYKKFDSILQELAGYLIPGLWTTFNKEGTKIVEKYINEGKIL